MKNYIYKISTVVFSLFLLTVMGCKKEYKNPGGANEADILSSPRGLTGVTVGLQRVYASGRLGIIYNAVTANGFVTNEILLLNQGNLPELQLSTGGATVDGTNTILNNLWTSANKVIYDADNVINNSAKLGDKSVASSLIAYASIFKALAIGNMAQYWESIPSSIGKDVTFITRVNGFNRAIATIDNALAVIAANPMSAATLSNLPVGIDVVNTLNALKARYALFAGNYPLALSSANLVDITKRSTFNFDILALNPIFETATSSNNVFQPINANLGLTGIFTPDPSDGRLLFHTSRNLTVAPLVRISGFGATGQTAYPVYLPSEITLIRAEVLARQPDLTNALAELNKVVTKTAAADPFGLGANLPALVGPFTQSELLGQIYRNRCIELYMSGLKLEDMRRFGLPLTDRKRNFFPYPFTERDNNTNTPKDPTF